MADGASCARRPPAAPAIRRRLLLTHDVLDVAALERAVTDERSGGVVSFVGVVRSPHRGRRVSWIDYEAYEAMAGRELARIADELQAEHAILGLAMAHRLGRVVPGEAGIAIVACSEGRDPAFAACRDALERCKARLPIWKHQVDDGGSNWVPGEAVPDTVVE